MCELLPKKHSYIEVERWQAKARGAAGRRHDAGVLGDTVVFMASQSAIDGERKETRTSGM
jgi:hypothetical protein